MNSCICRPAAASPASSLKSWRITRCARGERRLFRLHNPLFPERRDLGIGIAGFGEYLIRVFAETRRRAVDAAAVMREAETGAGQTQRPVRRLDPLHDFAMVELR